jgi:hypothetical protein
VRWYHALAGLGLAALAWREMFGWPMALVAAYDVLALLFVLFAIWHALAGRATPLRSNSPVIIAFHEWAALGRDLWQARSWRERLMCVIGPPGPRSGEDDPAMPSSSLSPTRGKIETETLSATG